MSRPIFDSEFIHPAIADTVATHHHDIVAEVQQAIATHKVVVVGMAQNPAPKRARKLLNDLGVAHVYLEYGSYFNHWYRRNALKMWTGWPTFPMIFISGVLIGGARELAALVDANALSDLL